VLDGNVPKIQREFTGYFATLMEWVDEIRDTRVRANADTPADAIAARSFGAEGIGLCRTERMFFQSDRINSMREVILADTEEIRRDALSRLSKMQRDDFVEILEIMAGYPVAIRLLDPPLHEFLPRDQLDLEQIAGALDIEVDALESRMAILEEVNPMLGNRGCRLLISYPEIADMQVRAIFEAAIEAENVTGEPIIPEIMVPLVGMYEEQAYLNDRIEKIALDVEKQYGRPVKYKVGAMIELPRAALAADHIAQAADFLSFGTNDLTQTTFGISRDDASSFWRAYEENEIFPDNPFVTIEIGRAHV